MEVGLAIWEPADMDIVLANVVDCVSGVGEGVTKAEDGGVAGDGRVGGANKGEEEEEEWREKRGMGGVVHWR